MIDRIAPVGTGRRRILAVTAAFVRCLDPRPAQRGDLGEAIAATGRPYPYRWWLHLQRRRRASSTASTDGTGEQPRLPGPHGRWEPDARGLVGAALREGTGAVCFHADGPLPGGGRRPRILPTPGPVGHLSPDPFGGALYEPHPGEDSGSGPPARIEAVRIDEVLEHREHLPDPLPPVPPEESTGPIAFVIPSPGNTDYLERLFDGLVGCEGIAEVAVVDNSPPSAQTDRFYLAWADRLPLSVEHTDPAAEFNYSKANNLGAAATSAPVIAFCNDDIELPAGFAATGALDGLTSWLTAEGIGVVGPQLRYPGGTIQHGGVVIGLNGLAEHAFCGMRPGSETLIGNTDTPRDVSAVTGAFMLTTREVFDSVGGFDEDLVLTGSDVWFCLEAAALGWGTAYDGRVHLVHHESAARGDTNHLDDVIGSARRWGHILEEGDPYWSARLAIHRHEPTLRRPSDPTSREMLERYLAGRGVDAARIASLRTCR